MQLTHGTTTPLARRRAGFTLTELMVVLLIITVLTTLAAGTLLRFMGSQQASNTRATLDKLQTVLNSRWSIVTRSAKDEPIPAAVQTALQNKFFNYVGTDPNVEQRKHVLYVKLRQRQEFPMTFGEALTPVYGLPPLPKFTNFFKSLGYSGLPQSQPEVESAILLLLALQSNQSGGGVSQDTLGGSTVGTVQLSSGQRVNALVDGWGTPLAFCRYPTGSTVLNPNGATLGPSRDPTDPDGYLMNGDWLLGVRMSGLSGALFLPRISQQPPTKNGQVTGGLSFRLAPLIASAGPDKFLGLDLGSFAPQDATANDNLYSKPQ
jgi:prepilin-type N-terminal cleavage/methylation domain-containing protein